MHAFEGDLVGGMPWLVDRLAEKGAEGGAELPSGNEQPAQRVGRAVGPLVEDVAANENLSSSIFTCLCANFRPINHVYSICVHMLGVMQ
ncbi:hypothetical protein ACFY04_43085 [Streptomyces sp. NPDC001549]|uniref:hypothetical protein n=1 Tax=Streptomyces sp. NPDC001549 TaxID=3364586 RepID=UPI0036A03247